MFYHNTLTDLPQTMLNVKPLKELWWRTLRPYNQEIGSSDREEVRIYSYHSRQWLEGSSKQGNTFLIPSSASLLLNYFFHIPSI